MSGPLLSTASCGWFSWIVRTCGNMPEHKAEQQGEMGVAFMLAKEVF